MVCLDRNFLFKNIIVVLFAFWMILISNTISKATTSEVKRLDNGEVVAKALYDGVKPPLAGAEAKVIINAPVEKVWDILDAQEKVPQFIPKFKRIKVLEKTDLSQTIETALKISPFLPTFKYTLLLDQSEKYKRIKFNRVAGCFNKLYGSFELEPYKGKTLLTYRMFIDSGIPLPSQVCTNGLTKDLPDIISRIKFAAENM